MENFVSYKKDVVFAARGTSLIEHLIPGGTEIKFKNNNLHYSGRAENWQLESTASGLPETNYQAALTLESLVVIICTAMFKTKIYLLHSLQRALRCHRILQINRDYVSTQYRQNGITKGSLLPFL
jgi:hypothetical protein